MGRMGWMHDLHILFDSIITIRLLMESEGKFLNFLDWDLRLQNKFHSYEHKDRY